MSRPSFNVLREPWIPVIRLKDGSSVELGILPCLEQAHELREIRDPAPIIEFGLYRLLVAFVLDALILAGRRPEDPLDLKSLIKEGHFEGNLFRKYIEQCGDVFDLFHPERPFLQIKMDKTNLKPIAAMFPAIPSGTNVILWHHFPENSLKVTAPQAGRLLTTIAPFMTAGGSGKSPSINGAPAIYALPVGKNLFETIIFNVPLRKQDSGNGAVAWRSKRSPGGDRSQATMVEALTWRPRKIQLVPEVGQDGSITVREMKYEKGDRTRLPSWVDANLAYRYTEDKGMPIRMQESRPLWRDAGPLLLLNEGEHGLKDKKESFRRPDVVEEAFNLYEKENSLLIQAYGMRTDMQKKVFEWVKSAWFVPSKLGRSTRLGRLVKQELDRADQAACWLLICIRSLFPRKEANDKKVPREKSGNKKTLGTISGRCERVYWRSLESRFHPLMGAFAALDPNAPDDPALIEAAARDWRETIKKLALEQFEFAADDMDADSDALERQVRARNLLVNRLRGIFS